MTEEHQRTSASSTRTVHRFLPAATLSALALIAVTSKPAVAQSDWRFSIDLYGWLSVIEGQAEIRGQLVDIDVALLDVIRQTEDTVGVIGRLEANNGQWGVWTDLLYLDLSFPAFTATGLDGVTPVDVSTDFSTTIWEVAAFYRLLNRPAGGPTGGLLTLDLYGGLRYVDFETSVSAISSLGNAQADSSTDWVDPIIGGRLRLGGPFGFNTTVLGDIGGFGVGSDLTWQAAAYVGYGWALGGGAELNAYAGYRALGEDYDDERAIDVVFHGPVAGLSLTF